MTSFKSFTSHLKASPRVHTGTLLKVGSFHVSLFAILSRPSSPPPLARRRRRHRCALCVFLHFSTANAHFFFFPASVELSKRSESNGSSLKFFLTMVAQTNNENARSLTRDLSFCALSSRVVSVQNAVRASSRSF